MEHSAVRYLVAVLGLGLALGLSSSSAHAAEVPAVGHENGVVAADHPLASAAGVEVLKLGGNAVDAACAVAFALGVVNPAGSGIGGGGFMLLHRAGKKEPLVLDFRETAPAAASRTMYTREGVARDASRRGGLAVGVPGEVAGCAEAVARYGRLPLRKVLSPAIRLARRGFPAGQHLAHGAARLSAEIAKRPLLARVFAPKGRPLKTGQLTRRPRLARTLTALAKGGPKLFYRGWIAKDIVAAVSKNGGVMTAKDLADYKVRHRKPLSITYRKYKIFSMPPPSSGGVAIIQALNILHHYDLAKMGHNSSVYLHHLTEALKHAFADRARHLGDPDFVKVPVAALTSSAYCHSLAARIGPKVLPPGKYGSKTPPKAPSGDSPGTSHLSVVDRLGNAVAMTTTINTSFGSLVVAPKSGIILNNEMDDFAARPGEPNAFGLIQGEGNAVAPNKRPLSSMSPTLVFDPNGRLKLVAGASGGPTIISGTLQAILNVVDFSLGATAAVSRSRVHHQWMPQRLMIEPDLPRDVVDNLRARGHRPKIWPTMFTAVQLVNIHHGKCYGASDPRKMGAPAGY